MPKSCNFENVLFVPKVQHMAGRPICGETWRPIASVTSLGSILQSALPLYLSGGLTLPKTEKRDIRDKVFSWFGKGWRFCSLSHELLGGKTHENISKSWPT